MNNLNDPSERSIKTEDSEDVDFNSSSFSSLNKFAAIEYKTNDFGGSDASLSNQDIMLARSRSRYHDLHVKHGKNKFRIQADVDDRVSDIKKELEDITGVPAKEQILTYNGLGIKFADDKSLKYYGCSSGGFFILTEKK